MNTQPEEINPYSEFHPFGIACDELMTDSYLFTGMTQEQEDRLLQIALENINVSLLKIAKLERTWRRELREKKRQEQKKNAMTDKQKNPAVQIDPASWDAGYTAGLAGKSGQPPDGINEFAYFSGIIEGKADRSKPAEQCKSQTRPEPTP